MSDLMRAADICDELAAVFRTATWENFNAVQEACERAKLQMAEIMASFSRCR